jgi:guanylate kinase
VLEERLRKRQTDTEDKIQLRLAKAAEELSHAQDFDYVVVNDELSTAIEAVERIVQQLISA